MHKKVQPINTFKFKDDRRSVTTEEIWVNRMARKQNEALLSSDPLGVTGDSFIQGDRSIRVPANGNK